MSIIKKYWPLIFLLVITIIYGFPYFFQGKIPFPSTYIANNIAPWNNYLFGGPVKNGIPDVPGEIFPMRSLVVDVWKSWQVPLWNPYVFSGSPLLANFQSAVFFPGNLLFLILSKVDAWSILVLLQPLLAGFFTFLLARTLKLSHLVSLFSTISFMFCGYLTVWGAYTTMGYTILFLPLVLYLVEKYWQDNKTHILPLITITLAVFFFSGHIQTWTYVLLTAVIYIIIKFLTEYITFVIARSEATKQSSLSDNKIATARRTSGLAMTHKLILLSLFLFLSLPLVAIQLLPTWEFYSFSGRALVKTNTNNIGIPFQYLITLLAPDFFGNPVTRNDWFGTYAEWSGYMGLIPLIFAILALTLFKKEKRIWPFITIGIIGFFLSIKTPILSFISQLSIPILSNSNPARAIVLLSFSLSMLSGFGIEQIINNKQVSSLRNKKEIKKRLLLVTTFISLLVLILFAVTLPGNYFYTEDIVQKLRTVSFRNLILPLNILFAVWLFAIGLWRKPQWKKLFVICLLLIVSFEMLRFYKKWTPFDDKNLFYPQTEVTEFLKKQNDYGRFYGQFGQTPAYTEHLYSLEGYEPLNLLSYSQLISGAVDGKKHSDYQLEVKLQSQELFTKRLLDLLGVKYLVYNAHDFQSPFVFPIWQYNSVNYPKIFDDGKFLIYENKENMGRVKLFADYEVIENDDILFKKLFDQNFDYKNILLLKNNPGIVDSELSTGIAEITSYNPDRVKVLTKSNRASLLFFNDNYYTGWKVYINDKLVPILKADYTFKAVLVPKGENKVVFNYEPESFKYGIIISGITLLLLMIFLSMSFPRKREFIR